MTKPASAWIEQLKAAPEAELVICDTCPAVAACPPVGIPDGWDGVWSQRTGHVFTCPGCLDRIEADYRAGGGGTWKPGADSEAYRDL